MGSGQPTQYSMLQEGGRESAPKWLNLAMEDNSDSTYR